MQRCGTDIDIFEVTLLVVWVKSRTRNLDASTRIADDRPHVSVWTTSTIIEFGGYLIGYVGSP